MGGVVGVAVAPVVWADAPSPDAVFLGGGVGGGETVDTEIYWIVIAGINARHPLSLSGKFGRSVMLRPLLAIVLQY